METIPNDLPSGKVEISPDLQALLPRQTDKEIAFLEESIRKQGILHPLTLWRTGDHYILLDGHTRFEIAKRIGIAIPSHLFQIAQVTSLNDAKKWMLRNQLGRRNLTDGYRAIIATELASLERGSNQHSSREPSSSSIAEAAATAQVSVATVKRARKVKTHGAPELIDAVKSGKVDVHNASTIADLPKSEQTELVKQGAPAIKAKGKAMREKKKTTNTTDRQRRLHEHLKSGHRVGVKFPTMEMMELADDPLPKDAPTKDAKAPKSSKPSTYGRIVEAPPVSQVMLKGWATFEIITIIDVQAPRENAVEAARKNIEKGRKFHVGLDTDAVVERAIRRAVKKGAVTIEVLPEEETYMDRLKDIEDLLTVKPQGGS